MGSNEKKYTYSPEQLDAAIEAVGSVEPGRCSQESIIEVINAINAFLSTIKAVNPENGELENVEVPKRKEDNVEEKSVDSLRVLIDLDTLLSALKFVRLNENNELSEEKYYGFKNYIQDIFVKLPGILPYLQSEEELALEDEEIYSKKDETESEKILEEVSVRSN